MTYLVPRVAQWSRGNGLPVSILASTITDATGAVTTASAITARVYVNDGAEPPTTIAGRSDVSLSLASGTWRGTVGYGTDLDAISSVRVIVTATIGSASARLADAAVALVRPSGR